MPHCGSTRCLRPPRAGAKFILGANLHSEDPQVTKAQVQRFKEVLPGSAIDSIALGNEPNMYSLKSKNGKPGAVDPKPESWLKCGDAGVGVGRPRGRPGDCVVGLLRDYELEGGKGLCSMVVHTSRFLSARTPRRESPSWPRPEIPSDPSHRPRHARRPAPRSDKWVISSRNVFRAVYDAIGGYRLLAGPEWSSIAMRPSQLKWWLDSLAWTLNMVTLHHYAGDIFSNPNIEDILSEKAVVGAGGNRPCPRWLASHRATKP